MLSRACTDPVGLLEGSDGEGAGFGALFEKAPVPPSTCKQAGCRQEMVERREGWRPLVPPRSRSRLGSRPSSRASYSRNQRRRALPRRRGVGRGMRDALALPRAGQARQEEERKHL